MNISINISALCAVNKLVMLGKILQIFVLNVVLGKLS